MTATCGDSQKNFLLLLFSEILMRDISPKQQWTTEPDGSMHKCCCFLLYQLSFTPPSSLLNLHRSQNGELCTAEPAMESTWPVLVKLSVIQIKIGSVSLATVSVPISHKLFYAKWIQSLVSAQNMKSSGDKTLRASLIWDTTPIFLGLHMLCQSPLCPLAVETCHCL